MVQDRSFEGMLATARQGKLSRRRLLKRAIALGLSAPAISALMAACGGSSSSSSNSLTSSSAGSGSGSASGTPTGSGTAGSSGSTSTPEASGQPSGGKRGGDGALRILYWQAPTVLNPAFSNGTKDYDAARLVLEPLFDQDKDDKFVPVLAEEVPSLENGQVAKDGLSVTVKLRKGVTWHDGQPFTANDVVFTWKYNANKEIASTWIAYFLQVKNAEVIDDYTVKYTFNAPYPAWFKVGVPYILPEHILKGSLTNTGSAKSDPFNLKPIGTGPYKVTDFKPGDVGTYAIYENYWDPGKPHFDSVTIKGGGDATSAARAVMQTSDTDWAWNLQVDPNVLKAMEPGGRGRIVAYAGGGCERFILNHSDPNTESNGQKSYYKVPHPHFKDQQVKEAISYLLDRKTIAQTLYGPGGEATGSTYNTNKANMPAGITDYEFNIDKANQILDQLGAKKGGDGIRVYNGRKMSWKYQTTVNDVRQKTQEIIKDSCKKAGINLDLKSIDGAVYFGDPSNPDSDSYFGADLEMETNTGDYYPDNWLQRYYSADPEKDIPQKSNGFSAPNFLRYQSDKFNQLYDQAVKELDPAKYGPLFQQLITLTVKEDIAEYGLVNRKSVTAAANFIQGLENRGAFSSSGLWDLKSWYRKS